MPSDVNKRRKKRLRKTKAQLIDELDKLEFEVARLKEQPETVAVSEAFRDDENLFRLVANTLPIGISLKDKRGKVVLANNKLLEWWKTSEADMLGKATNGVMGGTKENLKAKIAHEKEVWAKQRTISREEIRTWPDGGVRNIKITKIPVLNKDGETVLMCSTIEDITERRKAEEALQASEVRLRTALENMTGGLFMYDKDLNVQVMSPNFLEMYEVPPDMVVEGKSIIEVLRFRAERGDFGPGNPKSLVEKRIQEIRNPEAVTVEDRLPSGRIVELYRAPMVDGGIVGVFNDITERKQVEQELIASQTRLLKAQKIARVGDWSRNLETGRSSWSDEMYRIFGCDPETFKMTYNKIAGMFHPDDLKDVESSLKKAISNRKTHSLEYRIIRSDGEIRWVHVNALPAFNEKGEPVSISGTLQDITELRRAESALRESETRLKFQVEELTLREARLEAQGMELIALAEEAAMMRDDLDILNQQKDKFFSIIAHDLRGPFNALLGFSEILATQGDSLERERVTEYGTLVHDAGQRTFALLEDLLDWSRLQMGRMEFDPQSYELDKAIKENLAIFKAAAAEKNLLLKLDDCPALTASADKRMVDTILRNLISNAIKFTDRKGTVSVSATAHPTEKSIEVAVTDTGVGMSSGRLARLFRIDESSSTKGTEGENGTGLGLHLCKELVEIHGGEISVASAINEGTTVRFTLPVAA